MKWVTSLLTIGHQNCAIILNKGICECMCPDSGYMWHAEITINLNLTGATLSLICLTLDVRGVL